MDNFLLLSILCECDRFTIRVCKHVNRTWYNLIQTDKNLRYRFYSSLSYSFKDVFHPEHFANVDDLQEFVSWIHESIDPSLIKDKEFLLHLLHKFLIDYPSTEFDRRYHPNAQFESDSLIRFINWYMDNEFVYNERLNQQFLSLLGLYVDVKFDHLVQGTELFAVYLLQLCHKRKLFSQDSTERTSVPQLIVNSIVNHRVKIFNYLLRIICPDQSQIIKCEHKFFRLMTSVKSKEHLKWMIQIYESIYQKSFSIHMMKLKTGRWFFERSINLDDLELTHYLIELIKSESDWDVKDRGWTTIEIKEVINNKSTKMNHLQWIVDSKQEIGIIINELEECFRNVFTHQCNMIIHDSSITGTPLLDHLMNETKCVYFWRDWIPRFILELPTNDDRLIQFWIRYVETNTNKDLASRVFDFHSNLTYRPQTLFNLCFILDHCDEQQCPKIEPANHKILKHLIKINYPIQNLEFNHLKHYNFDSHLNEIVSDMINNLDVEMFEMFVQKTSLKYSSALKKCIVDQIKNIFSNDVTISDDSVVIQGVRNAWIHGFTDEFLDFVHNIVTHKWFFDEFCGILISMFTYSSTALPLFDRLIESKKFDFSSSAISRLHRNELLNEKTLNPTVKAWMIHEKDVLKNFNKNGIFFVNQ